MVKETLVTCEDIDEIIPIRIFPIDIGLKLDNDLEIAIKKCVQRLPQWTSMDDNTLKRLGLLAHNPRIGYQLLENEVCLLSIVFFKSGISIAYIKDSFELDDNIRGRFSVEYCEDRRTKHREIRNWSPNYGQYGCMEHLKSLFDEIECVLRDSDKKKKTTGLEQKGNNNAGHTDGGLIDDNENTDAEKDSLLQDGSGHPRSYKGRGIRKTSFFLCKEWVHKEKDVPTHPLGEGTGIPYVMTLSFIKMKREKDRTLQEYNVPPIKNMLFDWDSFDDRLKQNISILLRPEDVGLSETYNFKFRQLLSDRERDDLLSEVSVNESELDYEKRERLSAYMSWSSVVVVGHLDNDDILEYIYLQVNLQRHWQYLSSLKETFPRNMKVAKRDGVQAEEIQMLLSKNDKAREDVLYFHNNEVPTRILEVQRGLVETSRFENNQERYQRQMRYVHDGIMSDSLEKQTLFSTIALLVAFSTAIIAIFDARQYSFYALLFVLIPIIALVLYLFRKKLKKWKNVIKDKL